MTASIGQDTPSSLEAVSLHGEFNLDLTLNCGQVFHWQRSGAGYVGTIGSVAAYVEQRDNVVLASPGRAALLADYFALDHPLREIYASFPGEPAMQSALAACRGLRIIRQPLWECLASFITSALKQVAHIAQISLQLRARFGEAAGTINGMPLFAYPSVPAIAALTEAELRHCGLGFRAASLLQTARRLAEEELAGRSLEQMRALERPALLAALTEFRGVGTKVANCALLFGYGHLDAFPIDVWIERVLRERYFAGDQGATLPQLQEFSRTHFGPYGGYAQQYLFHHARAQGRTRLPKGATGEVEEEGTPVRRAPRRVAARSNAASGDLPPA